MLKFMMCQMTTLLYTTFMTNNSQLVFIDTSFFKAFFDSRDEFHQKAIRIWKNLEKKKASLLTTNCILDESFTLIRVRCTLQVAIKLRYLLHRYSSVISIERITIEDEASVWQWFEKDWSKLSFTDCVSFAVMKRLEITDVVTFDKHFEKAGFKIVK